MASASINIGSNETSGRRNRARTGGSAFTVFAWNAKPILFAKQISHQSPAPVGPGTVPIHPMDTPYPLELMTPMAATMGTITLELYELWGSTIWERLSGLEKNPETGGPVDIVGVMKEISEMGSPITIFKYIRFPSRDGGGPGAYTEEYHNVVVSQIMNGETIEVGTMEVLKQMVVNYTHSTIGGHNPVLNENGQLGGAISSNYTENLSHFA
jgi:hypothetical protein